MFCPSPQQSCPLAHLPTCSLVDLLTYLYAHLHVNGGGYMKLFRWLQVHYANEMLESAILPEHTCSQCCHA